MPGPPGPPSPALSSRTETMENLARTYSRAVAVCVFLLLIAGALVTSTDSGLAVPDWPLSYGKLMPPMVGGILFEHGHRLVAAAVSTLVGLQVAVLFLSRADRRLKRLSLLAFGAILLQALLGGLTVLLLLPPAVSSAHAGLAQVVFALTATIALLASRPRAEAPAVPVELGPLVRTAYRRTVAAAAMVYVQILLGAVVRHTGAGLAIPDFPLSFGRLFPTLPQLAAPGVHVQLSHRVGAVLVTVLVLRAAVALWRLSPLSPGFRTASALWTGLVATQVGLGALSVWSEKAVPATTAHLAVGALCWVTGVLTAVTLAPLARAAGGAPGLAAGGEPPSRARDILELTKPRITVFVVLTAFVGFAVGHAGPLASLDVALLLHLLSGTALVSSGTNAFNQLVEIDLDRRMARTAGRPLPSGRLPARLAFLAASALSVAGLVELWLFTNPVTTLLAFVTLTSYVFAYTPLKTRSPLSLLVGAVPGALPPLGGYTAAAGAVGAPGLVLFGLVFLWQLPHFLAIGWRHRRDYGEAGFRVLSVLDPTGRRSGRQALLYTAALLPVSLAPTLVGSAGLVYGAAAAVLTVLFLGTAVRFARQPTDAAALRLFLASIGWLPVVLVLLLLDRSVG